MKILCTVFGFLVLVWRASVNAAPASASGVPQVQEVFFAPFRTPPAPPPPAGGEVGVDFEVTSIEITQSVQCLDQMEGDASFCGFDNQIPLVVGKPTIVRVYVRSLTPTGLIPDRFLSPRVRVQFTVVKPDKMIISIQVGAVRAKEFPDRARMNDTANFYFLCEVCRDGDALRIRAVVEAVEGSFDTNPADNAFPEVEILMVERRPLAIEYRPVELRISKVEAATLPRSEDLLKQHTYLLDAFPVPSVSYREGPKITYRIAPEGFNDGDADNIMGLVNKGEAFVPACSIPPFPSFCPDQIVAWLPRAVWGNGFSDPIWGKEEGLSGAHRGVATVIDSMYTYGILGSPTLAHEIGHNLGRRHPTDEGDGCLLGDESWPYLGIGPFGFFADFQTQETGVRQLPVVASILIAPPRNLFDFMIGHRCRGVFASFDDLINGARPDGKLDPDFRRNGNWISPYTYHQLFCAQSPKAAESLESKEGRASPLTECNKKAGVPILLPPTPVLLVSGTLQPDGTGAIKSTYRIMEPGRLPEHEPGPFCVNLEKPGLTVPLILSQQCFDVSFTRRGETVPLPPGTPPQPAAFMVGFPWVDGGTQIVLERGGQPLNVVAVSPSAPQVQFVGPGTPSQLLTGLQLVQWQASDPDGDPLAFMLFYSPDGDRPGNERRLIPLAVDSTEMALEVDMDKLPGGPQAFFRLVATDNRGQTSVADSAPFSVPRKPPRVSIIAPRQISRFLLGSAIVFQGDVDDLEEAQLPPEAFLWSSNRDGPLALGPTIGTNTLSPGLHLITLTVTDSDGLASQAHVWVGISILPRPRKRQGLQQTGGDSTMGGNDRVDHNDNKGGKS